MKIVQLQTPESANYVYNILRDSGEMLYKVDGLSHWKNPYPLEMIHNDISGKYVYLVEEGNQYIATFTLSEKNSGHFLDDLPSVYLSKFAVIPEKLNRGIGSKILGFIENFAKEHNTNHIRLDVYDKNEKAINFYLKNGFSILYKSKTKNFNIVCMQKTLNARDNALSETT